MLVSAAIISECRASTRRRILREQANKQSRLQFYLLNLLMLCLCMHQTHPLLGTRAAQRLHVQVLYDWLWCACEAVGWPMLGFA
jgi:hypothetical protein